MAEVRKIEPTVIALKPRKRVAAYARISMESDRLNHSLSAQISYFSELIQRNPEWIYVGVYADSGISGGDIRRRAEFQRLIDDCNAGKIDIVLCKSISRFARSTVDLLENVRHLKSIGVEVRFEKENIHTLSSDGELFSAFWQALRKRKAAVSPRMPNGRSGRNSSEGSNGMSQLTVIVGTEKPSLSVRRRQRLSASYSITS